MFSVSQMSNAELARALPWRENEGEVNVFGKPEDQRELARFGLARKLRRSQTKDENPTVRHHTPKTKTMEGGCMFFCFL